MFIKIKIYLIVATILLAGCGVKNPAEADINLNAPIIVETIAKNKGIRLVIKGENRHGDYSGYNIYFNYSATSQTIYDHLIYIQSSSGYDKPTLIVTPEEGIKEIIIDFDNILEFSPIDDNYDPKNIDYISIKNGVNYFFTVKAYSYLYEKESDRSEIVSCSPREEYIEKKSGLDSTITHLEMNITFTTEGNLIGNNGTKIQDYGYYESWSDVTMAPEKGYSKSPWAIVKNHLYIFTTKSTNYGKFYINEYKNDIVNYNFSYQLNGNKI